MNNTKQLVNSISIAILVFLSTSIALLLMSQPASAGVNQCTWTGGGADNNWSTEANWICSVGTVPATGYDVIFPLALADSTSTTYDMSSSNIFAGIWLSDNATCTSPSGPGNAVFRINTELNILQVSGNINLDSPNDCQMSLDINNGTLQLAGDTDITLSSSAGFGMYGGSTTLNLGTYSLDINNGSSEGGSALLGADTTGSGTITVNGTDAYTTLSTSLSGDNSAYSGNIVVNGGPLFVGLNGLGSNTGTTTLNDGSSLIISAGSLSGNNVMSENFILSGTSAGNTQNHGGAKIAVNGFIGSPATSCPALSYTDVLSKSFRSTADISFTGDITLGSDVTIDSDLDVILTGNLSGSGFGITQDLFGRGGGSMNISAASNSTTSVNGLYEKELTSLVNNTTMNLIYRIGARHSLTVGTNTGDVCVENAGELRGTGPIGNLYSYGGILRPGLSPGILNTGNLDFDSATVVDVELEGTGAGEHDQFNVTGTVSLGGATLNTILFNGYAPNISDTFTIVNNDGSDAVVGTFAGLVEGAEIVVDSYRFTISYVGGTGNDVVLTTTFVPGPPGTGFDIYQNSMFIPAVAVASGIAILAYAQRKRLNVFSKR